METNAMIFTHTETVRETIRNINIKRLLIATFEGLP